MITMGREPNNNGHRISHVTRFCLSFFLGRDLFLTEGKDWDCKSHFLPYDPQHRLFAFGERMKNDHIWDAKNLKIEVRRSSSSSSNLWHFNRERNFTGFSNFPQKLLFEGFLSPKYIASYPLERRVLMCFYYWLETSCFCETNLEVILDISDDKIQTSDFKYEMKLNIHQKRFSRNLRTCGFRQYSGK